MATANSKPVRALRGVRSTAKNHLATAATMLRDMGMRAWLEKAKAEMDEGSR